MSRANTANGPEPVDSPRPPERADAVRNRRAILLATEQLLAEYPPEQVSMEQVALAAGVGKGTVFHRFGSRMGLMVALMQERALDLHDSVLSGPPPLGPGAPAPERLVAFIEAVVTVVARNKGLLAALGHAATTSTTFHKEPRDDHPIYRFWHSHVTALIDEDRPDLDGEFIAHVLLSSLQSDPVLRQLEHGDGTRLAQTLSLLATSALHSGVPGGRRATRRRGGSV